MPQCFRYFLKALQRFQEILNQPKTVGNCGLAIERFEIAFDFAWKVIQDILKERGMTLLSPRACFLGAFKMGLLDQKDGWNQMIADKTFRTSGYDEKKAQKIFSKLDGYLCLLQLLKEEIEKNIQPKK